MCLLASDVMLRMSCPVNQSASAACLCACLHILQLQTMRQYCVSMFRRPRQKRNATLFFTEAAVQCLNLLFYLLPNIYVLRQPCNQLAPFVFWSGWVRWTCWNLVCLMSPQADAFASAYAGMAVWHIHANAFAPTAKYGDEDDAGWIGLQFFCAQPSAAHVK